MLWQMVDHRFTRAHASEYLDGELPQAEHERVERHASVCPKCRALLASLRRMIETLPGLAAQPLPSVADGVLERLRREG
ncbi:MAG: zf-HC2 domain-containing protein [Actinomycetota bacterium]|nr:zf-HC2 domain-containing protein [Actinomycetota bacterium]